MSRHEFSCKNNRFQLALGVDHVTSVFFQIFDRTIPDEDDRLILSANNLGIQLYAPPDRFTDRQQMLISKLVNCFKKAKEVGNHYPNLSADIINQVANAFDINVSSREIYNILD